MSIDEKKPSSAPACVICGRAYGFNWGLNTCSAPCWEKAATPDDVRADAVLLGIKGGVGP